MVRFRPLRLSTAPELIVHSLSMWGMAPALPWPGVPSWTLTPPNPPPSSSALTSPELTWTPSFLSHLDRLPFYMVGDSAGMRIFVGMAISASCGRVWRRGAARLWREP